MNAKFTKVIVPFTATDWLPYHMTLRDPMDGALERKAGSEGTTLSDVDRLTVYRADTLDIVLHLMRQGAEKVGGYNGGYSFVMDGMQHLVSVEKGATWHFYSSPEDGTVDLKVEGRGPFHIGASDLPPEITSARPYALAREFFK